MNLTKDTIVLILVNRARELHKRLPGIQYLTKNDIIEKHTRTHTVILTPRHTRHAKPGDLCTCALAGASVELPEVYSTAVMRRITYMLERDEKGVLKIYKYGSPDAARKQTIRFDRRQRVQRKVVVFRPLCWTRTEAGRKVVAGRRGPTGRKNRITKASWMRTAIPRRLVKVRA